MDSTWTVGPASTSPKAFPGRGSLRHRRDEERFSSRTALGEAAVLTSAGRPFHRSEKARKKSACSVRSRKTTGRRGGGEEDTVESRKLKVEGQPKPRKIQLPAQACAARRARPPPTPPHQAPPAATRIAVDAWSPEPGKGKTRGKIAGFT